MKKSLQLKGFKFQAYGEQNKVSAHFLSFIFFLFILSSVHAQGEWVWAKSYSGYDAYGGTANNEIICSDFDREGNIYIFGKFGGSADIDGEEIFPDSLISLMGSPFQYDRTGIVLAKFSPQGNLIWKKVIRRGDQDMFPLWMEMKEDRISFLGTVCFGSPFYYLDTLVPNAGAFPFIPEYQNCFVTLDLDGNVIEEHLFRLQQRTSAYISNLSRYLTIDRAPFHVDRDGNVYLLAKVNHDGGNVEDPLTIIVDEEKSFDFYTNRACDPPFGLEDWILFKFSPDWDLLWYKQLVSHTSGLNIETTPLDLNGYMILENNLSFDEDDNLYIYGYVLLSTVYYAPETIHNYPVKIYWDDTHYTTISGKYAEGCQSFLCKYDPEGNVVWTKQLYPFRSESSPGTYTSFHDVIVNDSKVYAFGYASDKYSENPLINIFIDHELTIPLGRQNKQQTRSIFIIYDKQSGNYINHAFVGVEDRSRMGGKAAIINNHVIFSNRIDLDYKRNLITYFRNDGVLISADTVLENNTSSKKTYGNIHIHESGKLFFDIQTTSSITIGDLQIPANGNTSMAVFALKNDPSLLIPYEYDTLHIVSYEQERRLYLYPNPTEGKAMLMGHVENFEKLDIYDFSGRKISESNTLSFDITTYPSGIYLVRAHFKGGRVDMRKIVKVD